MRTQKRLKKIYPPHLKQTIQMEQILDKIISSLNTDITSSDMADTLHMNKKYFERSFQSHFEISFHQFVKKMKLRAAAEMLYQNRTVKQHWKEYGYSSNISFSKAFSQEFQMSPREFVKEKSRIPDMPQKSQVWGTPITCEYYTLSERTIRGRAVSLMDGVQTNLMEEVGYPFVYRQQLEEAGEDIFRGMKGYSEEAADLEEAKASLPENRYGIWWFDKDGIQGEKNQLYYLLAVDEADAGPEDVIIQEIPEDYYAVFSFERKENDYETALTMRLLARYIFMEWKKINRKTPNTIGLTFEWYGKDRAAICVPILEKYEQPEESGSIGYGLDRWIVYINDHIKDNLTMKHLAERAHYSEKSYKEIFQLYYEMEPLVYIRRRRLYLAAEEISNGADPRQVALEYHFPSYEEFVALFTEEFETAPDQMDENIEFAPINLVHYFQEFKNSLQIRFVMKDTFCILGHPVSRSGENLNADISELASWWFRQNAVTVKKDEGVEKWKSYVQSAVWAELLDPNTEHTNYEYILGPSSSSVEEVYQKNLNSEEDSKLIWVTGGRYAVFSTTKRSDTRELAKTYRMMNRVAFYGWIRENMYRYDGERLTFVEYTADKLYFYVPVKH